MLSGCKEGDIWLGNLIFQLMQLLDNGPTVIEVSVKVREVL